MTENNKRKGQKGGKKMNPDERKLIKEKIINFIHANKRSIAEIGISHMTSLCSTIVYLENITKKMEDIKIGVGFNASRIILDVSIIGDSIPILVINEQLDLCFINEELYLISDKFKNKYRHEEHPAYVFSVDKYSEKNKISALEFHHEKVNALREFYTYEYIGSYYHLRDVNKIINKYINKKNDNKNTNGKRG